MSRLYIQNRRCDDGDGDGDDDETNALEMWKLHGVIALKRDMTSFLLTFLVKMEHVICCLRCNSFNPRIIIYTFLTIFYTLCNTRCIVQWLILNISMRLIQYNQIVFRCDVVGCYMMLLMVLSLSVSYLFFLHDNERLTPIRAWGCGVQN